MIALFCLCLALFASIGLLAKMLRSIAPSSTGVAHICACPRRTSSPLLQNLIFGTDSQEARDLTRFDVDFDIPDHFLPDFPPAIYLNQRSDLGDVSQGHFVTAENYYRLFNGIINQKP